MSAKTEAEMRAHVPPWNLWIACLELPGYTSYLSETSFRWVESVLEAKFFDSEAEGEAYFDKHGTPDRASRSLITIRPYDPVASFENPTTADTIAALKAELYGLRSRSK